MNIELKQDIEALVSYILDSEESHFLEVIDYDITGELSADEVIEQQANNPALNHIYQNAYRVAQALKTNQI